MFKKGKKAFTLIELLAVIVVLAIIALITIPNIVNYIKKSKDQSFETSVDSIIRSYEYESVLNDNLGRVPVCSLDVEHCDYEGYIERDENGNIAIYLDAGDKCVIGIAGTYEIKEGGCAKEEDIPPVINEISISGINVLSATAYVNFEETGLVTSIKFRLKDENDNVVYDWTNADAIDNTSNIRVSKKTFGNLKPGKRYTIEVEVKNNAENNNTITASKEFETLNYTGPEITYSNEWEKEKTVTITYAKDNGIVNQYRTRSSIGSVSGWENVQPKTQEVKIKNYHYYVDAKSQIEDTILTSSAQIGYIDNEADPSNTKPSVEVIEYKNTNGVNTNEVGLELKDTLSGVGSYCIATTNNVENCIGTGTNKDLNKWVEASNVPEVREKTVLHELNDDGTYYVFLKDYVGNISDSKAFTVYKVHYDLNGGTGTVNDQIKLKDKVLVLNNTNLTREGYTFKGWSLTANSPVAYNLGANYTANNSLNLYAGWKANELTFNNQSFTKTFNPSSQTIDIVGASNGNGEYTYSEVSEKNSSNTSTNYITISNDGIITLAGSTPVGVYTYVVKATSQVDTNVDSYTEVTKEATMTITVNPYNLSNATISDIGAVNYNGLEQKPTPDVTAQGVELVNGADFTYSYANNISAGTATVTITGKGNYTGQNSKTFTINRVTAPNKTVTCATLTYNGTNQSLISTTNISNGSVYYKIGTELTSSNYTTGSTTKPSVKDAGSYVVYYYAPADNYTETKGSVTCSVAKANATMSLSPTSGTHLIGTNGTTTVSGSNYGTLSCSSSNTSYATCSVSGTTVTIVPVGAGSATITVTGSGSNNYNSISKTYAATIQLGYKCASGTLTYDAAKGASSGGYICVTNGTGTRSCNNHNYRCSYDAYTLWGCDANYNYTQFNKPALTNQSAVTYSSVGQSCPNGVWGCQNDVRTFNYNPGTKYSKILSTSDYEYSSSINYMSSSAGLVYYTQCTYVFSSGRETCSQSTADIATFESRQASLPSNQYMMAYMGYAAYVYQNQYYGVAIRYSCTITYGASEAGACAPIYRTGKVTCPDGEVVTYNCPSGWSAYNSDNSKCYKAATR